MKWNKETFLNIWRDPVGSKIISAGILAFVAALYASIKSIVKEEAFINSVMDILTMQIKLWHVLVIAAVSFIIYSIRVWYRKRSLNEACELSLQYRFLAECKTELKGFKWEWTWSNVKGTSCYKIKDLHPLCPNCNGILTIPVIFGNYVCGKCDYVIDIEYIPSIAVIKKQIIHDLRNRFPEEALFMLA